MEANCLEIYNEQLEKFNQLKDILTKENSDLLNQIDQQKNHFKQLQQNINEVIEKLNQTKQEKSHTEILLKLEELKQKTCSDETIKSLQTLVKELDNEIEIYRQKTDNYKQISNIELKMLKESKTLKVTLLNYDQEIFLKFNDLNNIKASYEKVSDEMVENEKDEPLKKLVEQFNSNNTKKPILRDFILSLKDLSN